MDANMLSLAEAVSLPLMLLIFALAMLVMAIGLVHLARAHATVNQLREQIREQQEQRRPPPYTLREPTVEERFGTDEDLEEAVRAARAGGAYSANGNGAASPSDPTLTFAENANVNEDQQVDGGTFYRGRQSG